MEFQAVFAGSFLTFILLIVAHMALWPYRARMRRVHSYIVGTFLIGVGVTMTAFLLQDWIIAITFWCVAGPGGFAIAIAWWIREGAVGGATADTLIAQAKKGFSRAAVPGESDNRRN